MERPDLVATRHRTAASERVAYAVRDLGVAADVTERVVERFPSGAPARSELLSRRAKVALVLWSETGRPTWGWSLRRGKKHGLELEWHEGGRIAFAEPWVRGLAHGTARQWNDRGELLVAYAMDRGSGVELWCDARTGRLAEETTLVRGRLHGVRRWWSGDDRTIHAEEHFREGEPHGIERRWDDARRLRRGWLRYFSRGVRVSAREYAVRAAEDGTLPVRRAIDDEPSRALPPAYVASRRLLRARSE